MGNSNILSEKAIRRILFELSKQRVLILAGNDMVIDSSFKRTEESENALMTCWFRGWVEPVEKNVMQADLSTDLKVPPYSALKPVPLYRLTEAGWNVIHRTQLWIISTFLVALATLSTAVLGIFITISLSNK